jgi:hypothetical protein
MEVEFSVHLVEPLTYKLTVLTPYMGTFYIYLTINNVKKSYLQWKHFNEYIRWNISHELINDDGSVIIEYNDKEITFKLNDINESVSITSDLCRNIFNQIESRLLSLVVNL